MIESEQKSDLAASGPAADTSAAEDLRPILVTVHRALKMIVVALGEYLDRHPAADSKRAR